MISLYDHHTGRYLGQGQVNVSVPPATTPPTAQPAPQTVVFEPSGVPVVPAPTTVVAPPAASPYSGISPVIWVAGGLFAAGLVAMIVTSGKK